MTFIQPGCKLITSRLNEMKITSQGDNMNDETIQKVLLLQQNTNQLKLEVRYAETWIERAKKTIYENEELIFDLQDKGVAI